MTEDCLLYLISPPEVGADFPDRLRAALEAAPVAAFQLRVKGMDEQSLAKLGEPLQKICADLDTAFIVNDSISLAKKMGADGVHLGQADGDPRDARVQLGRDAQIGVTCHNSRHFAMEAGEAGADYVAFGAFFQTGTKNVEHYADLELLRWWNSMFELPCVAIGGITAENARPLVEAGADFIAVCASVWSNPVGEAAAVRLFSDILMR